MNRNRMFRCVIGLVTGVVLTLAGCTRYAAAREELVDAEISAAVERKLARDPATPADGIDVAAVGGIVSLSGSVSNLLARERAGVIAETVKGVTGVVNRIEVAAPRRPDPALAADVTQALRSDPAARNWDIAASAEDGTVILEGRVDSWQAKSLAARVAKGVRGVRAVDNAITVAYTTDRSDAAIRRDVEAALRWYAHVDASRIAVEVADGRVSLSGTVASLAEKRLARAVSWVAGVNAVDNSGLEIDWAARKREQRRDVFTPRSSDEIASAVFDALSADPRVDPSGVEISVEDGLATLRGTVGDLKAKRTAAVDADNVVGVRAVENRLTVVPSAPPSDARIEAGVQEALLRNPYVDRYAITVRVSGGEVYLSGAVDSAFEKGLADDVAARQAGVTRVYNNLTVEAAQGAGYDPYTDDYNIRAYEWYDAPTAPPGEQSDWEIERNVRRELFWSPFVESEDIEISVNNGVVELTGTVDSWSEREQAEKSALEGGARSVDNDLAVVQGLEYSVP